MRWASATLRRSASKQSSAMTSLAAPRHTRALPTRESDRTGLANGPRAGRDGDRRPPLGGLQRFASQLQ
jgi:hypothetical protein